MAESKAKELGKTFQNLALYARSVSNTFNVIQGKLKKASECLSKASDDDPEAAKVASQAVNGVDAEVRQQMRQFDREYEDLESQRSYFEKAAKAKKR